jgi:hypothetical protein
VDEPHASAEEIQRRMEDRIDALPIDDEERRDLRISIAFFSQEQYEAGYRSGQLAEWHRGRHTCQ